MRELTPSYKENVFDLGGIFESIHCRSRDRSFFMWWGGGGLVGFEGGHAKNMASREGGQPKNMEPLPGIIFILLLIRSDYILQCLLKST